LKTKRPAALIIASILLILASLVFGLTAFLPGADRDPGPPVVLYASVILGVLGLIAASGIFARKRWGRWLSILASVFSAFFAAGGILYSSDAITKGLAALLVALYALVIVLVVLPSARQTYEL